MISMTTETQVDILVEEVVEGMSSVSKTDPSSMVWRISAAHHPFRHLSSRDN